MYANILTRQKLVIRNWQEESLNNSTIFLENREVPSKTRKAALKVAGFESFKNGKTAMNS